MSRSGTLLSAGGFESLLLLIEKPLDSFQAPLQLSEALHADELRLQCPGEVDFDNFSLTAGPQLLSRLRKSGLDPSRHLGLRLQLTGQLQDFHARNAFSF